MLKPELTAIPREAKQLFESEEDALTYVLFPQTALEFFKKRTTQQEEPMSKLLPPQERQELEEVAAITTAVVNHLKGRGEIVAVIPTRRTGRFSGWSMAGRQELMAQRGQR